MNKSEQEFPHKLESMKNLLISIIVLVILPLIFFSRCNNKTSSEMLDLWTENWRVEIFKDANKPADASNSLELITAKNDIEPAQIVMRAKSDFIINGLEFSDLSSGRNKISSNNLDYYFIGYRYLEINAPGCFDSITNYQRKAPDYFPEQLLEDISISVSAETTQSIWVRVYVPETTLPGNYSGTIIVKTSLGKYRTPINVEVNDATIMESQNGKFNWEFWQFMVGSGSSGMIEQIFGYKSYSPEWWKLQEKAAKILKEGRVNVFLVNWLDLLIDGGTTIDVNGKVTFNWNKFDEYIQFYMDREVIKTLAGSHLCGKKKEETYVYSLIRDSTGTTIKEAVLFEEGGKDWLDQFLPALYNHLQQKDWLNKWYQHIMDEPKSQQMLTRYHQVSTMVSKHMPGVIRGDALNRTHLIGYVDRWISVIDTYNDSFKERQALGEEVWFYTCCWPGGNWLNRFIDQELYLSELLSWFGYKNDLPGFLHWGMMWWHSYPDCKFGAGDCWSVYPDTINGNILSSVRMEAMREAAEDFELFKILEVTNAEYAMSLASSLVSTGTEYVTNIDTIIDRRNLLVRTAANRSNHTSVNQHRSFDKY